MGTVYLGRVSGMQEHFENRAAEFADCADLDVSQEVGFTVLRLSTASRASTGPKVVVNRHVCGVVEVGRLAKPLPFSEGSEYALVYFPPSFDKGGCVLAAALSLDALAL
jgi:hypothetical protein